MKTLTILTTACLSLALSGCAVTTAAIPGKERKVVRSVNDVSAERAIKARMSRAADFDLSGVDIEVAENIAVLTGSTPTEDDRIEAERIAWSAPFIKKVGNEVLVNNTRTFKRKASDSLLNTQIQSRLIAAKSVKSTNYNIETHNGVVYLLGVARTPQELERVAELASTTKGTREVISYIKLSDETLQTAGYTAATGAVGPSVPYTDPNITPQRPLPPSLSPQPNGSQVMTAPDSDFMPFAGPTDPVPNMAAPSVPMVENAPADSEPFFRDPVTGERITLPPGTVTVPYDPNVHGPISGPAPIGPGPSSSDEAPYYINQDTGEKVMIVYRRPVANGAN